MQVDAGDFSLAYEDQGQGIPLLLIHGFPLDGRMWQPQAEDLSGTARVLVPDLRGFGESDAPQGPYSMDLLADDCRTLLASAGVEQPAVVCGLSMGGYVALAFYRRHPDLVAGLILAATRAGGDSPEGKANRDRMVALVEQQGANVVAAAMLPKMLSPVTYASRLELVGQINAIMQSASVPGLIGALLGMKERPDATPMLPQVSVPTLILHGADDQLISPKEAQAMQAAIPDARLGVLQEAGHLLNLEQPELFNQYVKGFLDSFASKWQG